LNDQHLEIERRFLVDGREEKPWREGSQRSIIEQHYGIGAHVHLNDNKLEVEGGVLTALSEEELALYIAVDDWVLRLRISDGTCILTCKSRVSTSVARELEWVVNDEVARDLLAKGPFPHVEKTRYMWRGEDGMLWEVDEFEGALAGLVLAEVELVRPDEAVVMPSWIGQEITGLASWSNHSLAQTLAFTPEHS
jgi:CYTH domain-containing protein